MRQRTRLAQVLQVAWTMILGACAVSITPSPTFTPESRVIPTATPTSIRTTQVSPTAAIPNAIDTADADRPLLPNGPWWMVVTAQGIWIMNPDGSGLSEITTGLPHEDISPGRIAVASSGGRIALLSGSNLESGLRLNLLTLPQGGFQTIATLLEAGIEFSPSDGPGSIGFEAMQALTAINSRDSFAWSPDGKLLAFMGMIDGPSSDLYTYAPESGEITRLTDGPSHGYRLSWSPDGRYILHAGVTSFGTGAGYSMAGVWAARADGSGVREIDVSGLQGDVLFHGWTSNSAIMVSNFNALCGFNKIRSVDIETGEVIDFWPGGYMQFAWNPETGGMLVTIDPFIVDDPICNPSGLSGLVFIDPQSDEPRTLLDKEASELHYSPNAHRFFARLMEIYEISPDGEILRTVPAIPAVSPDGSVWAYLRIRQDRLELSVGSPLTLPSVEIDADLTSLPIVWDRTGDRLLYIDGTSLFIAEAPNYIPVLVTENLPGFISAYTNFAYWIEY
jgi:hypothetical protein